VLTVGVNQSNRVAALSDFSDSSEQSVVDTVASAKEQEVVEELVVPSSGHLLTAAALSSECLGVIFLTTEVVVVSFKLSLCHRCKCLYKMAVYC